MYSRDIKAPKCLGIKELIYTFHFYKWQQGPKGRENALSVIRYWSWPLRAAERQTMSIESVPTERTASTSAAIQRQNYLEWTEKIALLAFCKLKDRFSNLTAGLQSSDESEVKIYT